MLMAGILDFDTDRMRVDIPLAAPVGSARVPRTQTFRNQLRNPSVFVDYVMAGNSAFGAPQPIDGLRRRRHAGIMQDEKRRLRAAAPWLPVFRRMNCSDVMTVGCERHWLGS